MPALYGTKGQKQNGQRDSASTHSVSTRKGSRQRKAKDHHRFNGKDSLVHSPNVSDGCALVREGAPDSAVDSRSRPGIFLWSRFVEVKSPPRNKRTIARISPNK